VCTHTNYYPKEKISVEITSIVWPTVFTIISGPTLLQAKTPITFGEDRHLQDLQCFSKERERERERKEEPLLTETRTGQSSQERIHQLIADSLR
jgi:hypothetical protein